MIREKKPSHVEFSSEIVPEREEYKPRRGFTPLVEITIQMSCVSLDDNDVKKITEIQNEAARKRNELFK